MAPGMQGWRNVGRGKREKVLNGHKIKANGTVRRSSDDKRAEKETMGSFSDSKQFFYQLLPPQKKSEEMQMRCVLVKWFAVAHKLCLFCSWMFEQTMCRIP